MRLLFLIHRLPCPPDRGSKVRAAVELQHLARRHEVWCAGFLDSPGLTAVRESLEQVRALCREVWAVPLRRSIAAARAMGRLVAGGTCTEGYFASRRLRRQVLRWSRQVRFDAVLAFSSSMAPLALQVAADRRVLDLDDLDSRKWAECAQRAGWPMSWVYRTEARRLGGREREWIAAFDASVLVNKREADLLADEAMRRRVHVIEAGVPLANGAGLCGPAGENESGRRIAPAPLPEEPMVGFIGAMDYPPNVDAVCWFAEAIWPRVQQRRPDAKWLVVGRSPTRAVRKLDGVRGIRVTGTVPAVEPYLDRIRVSVAPLRLSRGVQIKVLVAMAAGRPCVVTPSVAEGLGARSGHELVTANSAACFAEAVVSLLDDRVRAEAIGRAGRRFVVHRVQSGRGLARLEELLCPNGRARLSRTHVRGSPIGPDHFQPVRGEPTRGVVSSGCRCDQ